ncbi:hypothetical protein BJ912DRAFT_1068490 [Pholiota molesta]|nr:hypothetical protein BJ912DRAFT_1068490 [Pholiota molesta]
MLSSQTTRNGTTTISVTALNAILGSLPDVYLLIQSVTSRRARAVSSPCPPPLKQRPRPGIPHNLLLAQTAVPRARFDQVSSYRSSSDSGYYGRIDMFFDFVSSRDPGLERSTYPSPSTSFVRRAGATIPRLSSTSAMVTVGEKRALGCSSLRSSWAAPTYWHFIASLWQIGVSAHHSLRSLIVQLPPFPISTLDRRHELGRSDRWCVPTPATPAPLMVNSLRLQFSALITPSTVVANGDRPDPFGYSNS